MSFREKTEGVQGKNRWCTRKKQKVYKEKTEGVQGKNQMSFKEKTEGVQGKNRWCTRKKRKVYKENVGNEMSFEIGCYPLLDVISF